MSELDPSVGRWLAAFAASLGTAAPSDAEIDELLALAGVAAHASARQAAPIACWLAARAGVAPADALARARAVTPS
jgi:CRISPR/Cas system-associated protein Csm6